MQNIDIAKRFRKQRLAFWSASDVNVKLRKEGDTAFYPHIHPARFLVPARPALYAHEDPVPSTVLPLPVPSCPELPSNPAEP